MFVRVALLFRNVWILTCYIFLFRGGGGGAILGAVKIFNRYPRILYGRGFIITRRKKEKEGETYAACSF